MEEFSWKAKINKLYNFIINYDNKAILFLILIAIFTAIHGAYKKAALVSKEYKNYIENKND